MTGLPPPPVFSAITGVEQEPVPLGARIGAALMIVNAFLLVIERLVMKSTGTGPTIPVASIVVDLWIGTSLLAGKVKFLAWARWRIVIGAVVLTALYAVRKDTVMAVTQLVFSLGFLALFVGRPARPRIWAGVVTVGVSLLLESYGLLAETTGSNPLATLLQSGRFESGTVSVLKGRLFPYEMRFPSGWHLVKAGIMQKENPAIDRFISKPDSDAHVYVIAERLPSGAELDMETLERAYLEQAKENTKSLRVLDAPAVRSSVSNARFLHTRGEIEKSEVESYVGLFESAGEFVQVVTLCESRRFSSLEGEFRGLLGSFAFVPAHPGETMALR